VRRIFVVDDEPDVTDLLRTILEVDGFTVESATDGREALARVLADPPHLLVLDLMMPDLDGFELLKLLRLDPRGTAVPVLVVSARSGRQHLIESLQRGANAYVCKPFSPRELMRQVRQLLGLEDEERADD
jgi:DNA-binding response OmpR family regulator